MESMPRLELNKFLQVIDQISQIFPNTKEELGNRHCTLFSQLKFAFNQLYNGTTFSNIDLNPTHYIIVKGLTEIVKLSSWIEMPMNVENGLIVLVRKTNENGKIYFNGNHIDEEIIFENNGQIYQGINHYNHIISNCLKVLYSEFKIKHTGMIFYVHANIPQDYFCYLQSLELAIILGVLTATESLKIATYQSIFLRLMQNKSYQLKLTEQFLIKSLNGFKQDHIRVKDNSQIYEIPFESKLKMILCKLDFSQSDLEHFRSYSKNKDIKMKQFFKNKHKENQQSILEKDIKQSCIELASTKLIISQFETYLNDYSEFCSKEQILIKKFIAKDIGLGEFINQLDANNTNNWMLYTTGIIELVQRVKDQLDIHYCLIIEEQFLLILVESKYIPDLMCQLRKKANNGELSSINISTNSFGSMEKQSIDHAIRERLFSTVPGPGATIYDPTNSIWFKQQNL